MKVVALKCPKCGSLDWEWIWKGKPWGKPEVECHACFYVGIMYDVRTT